MLEAILPSSPCCYCCVSEVGSAPSPTSTVLLGETDISTTLTASSKIDSSFHHFNLFPLKSSGLALRLQSFFPAAT